MKKYAFTLAELLMTLGIIGVVAVLTMPGLIKKYQEKETIVKLQKFYSVMSQAYLSVLQANGTPDNWALTGNQTADEAQFVGYIKPYLNVATDCGFNAGCFPDLVYKRLNGTAAINFLTNSNKRYMMRLADGSPIAFFVYPQKATGDFGVIYLDTNGDRPPNQFGKDVFQIMMMQDRLSAGSGVPDTNIYSDCLTNGFACSAWVIAYDNMDYLHCPNDLSWYGKTSCK